jgi:hypothetical protein
MVCPGLRGVGYERVLRDVCSQELEESAT